MKTKPGIFLSHSHHDACFVRRLAADLSRSGASVWYYQAEIRVGDSLIARIEGALEEMDYLGVVLSCHSVESEWVRREVEIALNREIRGRTVIVLPLLLEPCNIPVFLSGKFYADFTSASSYDRGFSDVLQVMGLTEKGAAREELEKLASSVMSAYADVYALHLENVSPSFTEYVPQKDKFYKVSEVYEEKAKCYEEKFQEYYDPLSLFHYPR
jgi:hypothetical protein